MSAADALNEYIAKSGMSQNAVAKAMGISASALSQYLKNKYPGDIGILEKKISQFLNLSFEREEYPQTEIGFIETSVSEQINETAKNCHIGCRIGIVTGESGLGKTTAVKHYKEENPDVMIVYARPSITHKSLMREIAVKAGTDPSGAIDEVFMRTVTKLKGSGRMIIIDEAEHLTPRTLDQVRRFNDPEFAGLGVLLIGLPKLLYTLRNEQNDHKYIYSRVGWNMSVAALSDKDCKSFVLKALPNSGDLWKTYAACSRRNTRALRNLIERSIEIAYLNELPLTAELIEETAKILIN